MTRAELLTLEKRHLWHPFTPMREWCDALHEPLMLVKGRGCSLWDSEGREYLDGNSSIWTNAHGHAHPAINAAIADQLQRVAHTSFLGFTHPPAIELAKALVDLFPSGRLSRVFYSDNGSTAIESAVRMALQYWQRNGRPERDTLFSFDGGYHGDTLGAASLGGLPVYKGSGNDFGYKVICVPSMEALHALPEVAIARLAGVIIEPLVQGAAGIRTWPAGMLKQLETWCGERDVFLILDEVMTGFGRTGRMFACEHEDVIPDFLCLAKGLSGGYLPLAVTLTTERVFEGFLGEGQTFYYGHSFTGNQLGCAAALASLKIFKDEAVIEHLAEKVKTLTQLLGILRDHPHVKDIRQCGLVAGIELCRSREPLVDYDPAERMGAKVCLAARAHGLLTRPVVDTLVLMPPLCVTDAQMERMVEALRLAIADVIG
ncbi:MAG: pyridoxal phosphate-dependent transferase [Verrucomicrobiaceae bacterium]|nr:pyridoxal phosphate-dependent transferase [Verrucomicrobiaceae bacterium]